MELTIRKANVEDANEYAKVNVLSWQAAYKGIVPDEYLDSLTIESKVERFIQNLVDYPECLYYAAIVSGKIVGILLLNKCRDDDMDDSGEICAIYLLPEYWGKGCGKQLMDFSLDTFKHMGFHTASIWVLEENARARRFYEKCGFVPDGAKKVIEIGKPLIAVRYRNGADFMKTLKTERLLLRGWQVSDFEAAHAYASDPANVIYMGWGPNTEEDTRKFIKQSIKWNKKNIDEYSYAVILKENGKLIGGCGISINQSRNEAMLGWILHKDYW